MIRLGIGLLVLSGVFGYYGLKEWRVSRAASSTPEEITLKALIDRGPHGNPNIILTEFFPADNMVCQERKYSKDWEQVWVPIMPLDSAFNAEKTGVRPTNVEAILVTTHARNESELRERLDQPKLPALVTNELRSLGSKEKGLLSQSYPNTNFDKCLIIEEGREPASSSKLLLLCGGAGLAGVVGAVLLVLGLVRKKW
jgi:hypothetical protein